MPTFRLPRDPFPDEPGSPGGGVPAPMMDGLAPIVTETDDGGALVDLNPQQEVDPASIEHDANLAEVMGEPELMRLSNDVLEAIEADDESRADWKESVKDVIDLLGLRNKPRNEPFPGACGVVYPLIMEAAIRFHSKALGEHFPADGPFRAKIIGAENEALLAQADRVKDYLNWLALEGMPDYYADFDQMLFLLAVVGQMFRKVYWDEAEQRPVDLYVHPDDIILPYSASGLASAERITHVLRLSHLQLRRQMVAGVYRDVDLPDVQEPIPGPVREEADKIDGKEPTTTYRKDARREVYECHAYLDMRDYGWEEQGQPDMPLPWLVVVDKETRRVLAVRRNWREGDERAKRRDFFVSYPFMRGLGPYGYGFGHILGGIARGATALLRQIVDAGAFSNLPAGFKAKGAKPEQNNLPLAFGEFREIDTMGQPISEVIALHPFKEPSATLFNMLNGLAEAGSRLAGMTEAEVGDGSTQQPVGTVMALLEQSGRIQAAIHKRIYDAQRAEARMLSEMVRDYMPGPYPFAVTGGQEKPGPQGQPPEQHDKARDFDDRVDILPVADPTAFSSTQRLMRAQAELQTAMGAPQIHNVPAAFRRYYEAMGVDPDAVMAPDPPPPVTADPVYENMVAMKGARLAVRPDQNHAAHCDTHLAMLRLPGVPQSPAGAMLFGHCVEHELLSVWTDFARTGAQHGVQVPMPGQPMEPAMEAAYAQMSAQAMQRVVAKLSAVPPPVPPNPEMMQAETNRMEVKLDADAEKREDAIRLADVRVKAAEVERKRQEMTMEAEAERQRGALEAWRMYREAAMNAGGVGGGPNQR